MKLLDGCLPNESIKKGRASFIILIFIVFAMAIGMKYQGNAKKAIGNFEIIFPANQILKGDWMYYISPYDNHLYKINIEKRERVKLSETSIGDTGIVLLENNIYYVDSSNSKLFSIDLQDNNISTIGKCKIEYPGRPLFRYAEFIYYYDEKGNLHRVDSKGTQADIGMDNIMPRINYNSKTYGDLLFSWGEDGLASTNISSGLTKKICGDPVAAEIDVFDGRVFYINKNDLKLYSIDFDGTDRERLSEGQVIIEGADFDSGNMEIYGEQIYFTNVEDIYKFDLKEKKKEKLINDGVYFKIAGNSMYYMSGFDGGELVEINLKDMSRKVIASGDFIPYIERMGNLLIYGMKAMDIEEPSEGRLYIFDMSDNSEFEVK